MVKVCKQAFPKGSFKYQKSDGFYIDERTQANLNLLAEKIVKDWFFTLIVSGSGNVRIGKSVLAQQIGYYITNAVNRIHDLDREFTLNNIVFSAEELMEKALELPPYSIVILDEGDDLTTHYWSKLARRLRRFYRKSGQLNLIFILVIPDFFELNKKYAITRSRMLFNVKTWKLERGYYDVFNNKAKKNLYFQGKKRHDYNAWKVSYDDAHFFDFYPVGEQAYRKKKREDLQKEIEKEKKEKKTPTMVKKEQRINIISRLKKKWPDLTQKELGKLLGVTRQTINKDMKHLEGNGKE